MWLALRHRVRWGSTLLGAAAFGGAQGLVRVASTVWSEAPYIAISLATMLVIGRPIAEAITVRRAAIGGALAGVGFLTRYAGAGLVMTALVMVAVAAIGGGRRHILRCVGATAASAGAIAAVWVVRNLIETGEALGPRFEGGTAEPLRTLVQRPFAPIGQLVVGFPHVGRHHRTRRSGRRPRVGGDHRVDAHTKDATGDRRRHGAVRDHVDRGARARAGGPPATTSSTASCRRSSCPSCGSPSSASTPSPGVAP